MIYLLKRLFRVVSINKNLDDKINCLRKAGLNISAIDKNDRYKSGYVLGKMKDNRTVTRIYSNN